MSAIPTCGIAEREEYSAAAGYGDTPEQWEALRLVRYPGRMLRGFQERNRPSTSSSSTSTRSPLPASALLRQFDTNGRPVRGAAPRRHVDRRAERRAPRPAPTPFAPQQVRIARGIAHLASLALETARLVDELEARQSAQVRVRRHHVARAALAAEHHHRLPRAAARRRLRCAHARAQRDPLRRADRSARELLELINATLDLSRLEAKRIALDLGRWCRSPRLVDEVGRELAAPAGPSARRVVRWSTRARPAAAAHRSREAEDGAEEPGRERGEVHRARRASRSTRWRTPTASSSASPTPASGIAPEAQAAIFEPFRQIDVRRWRVRGGVGLGLYIVKQLLDRARRHDRRRERGLGSGSTFRVWLPLHRDAERQSAAPDPRRAGDSSCPRRSAARNGWVRRRCDYQRRSRSRGGPPRPAAAATRTTRSALARFADLERAAVERLPVERGDRLLRVVARCHLHEGESARPSAHAIGDDRDGDDLTAIGRERRAQPFFGGGVGEIADVELGAHPC